MRTTSRSKAVVCAALLCILLFAPASSGAESDLLLILDASGSMWGQISGENKIVIAREVLASLVDGLDDSQNVGLIAYGHRREGDCQDIELISEIGLLDRPSLKAAIDQLNPKGKTPITAAMNQAFDAIAQRDASATVILVSDGLETCGGDPCGAVRTAKQSGIDFKMHIIGFDVAKEDVSSLECAAQAGDGLFLAAENADQLGAALDAAMALTADVPAGGLSVKTTAGGELHDSSVLVTTADGGREAGQGRTYRNPNTNPRKIALVAGTYKVKVQALGINGDVVREFEVTIPDGQTVEREFDFSPGTLSVEVTRNGELSDATVSVLLAGSRERIARGRTYTKAANNPRRFSLTSGAYDVQIQSVEIKGTIRHRWESVEVGPGGQVALSHDFASGTLRIGALRDGRLVDAGVRIANQAGKAVAQGRTYDQPTNNPKEFTLVPGEYKITVTEVRGDRSREIVTVQLKAGETVERSVELP